MLVEPAQLVRTINHSRKLAALRCWRPRSRYSRAMSGSSVKTASEVVIEYIREQLASRTSREALVVGIQAPQGSGKSYVTDKTCQALRDQGFRVAAASLDDFYLTHAELVKLAETCPKNKLLHGRGQPGTHNVDLAAACLNSLQNALPGHTTHIPQFDKSLFSGEGDRSPTTIEVTGPVDVIIFEGWMVGFKSIHANELRDTYNLASADPAAYASKHLDYKLTRFLRHDLTALQDVNERLQDYESKLWPLLQCMVRMSPRSMVFVWEWRLQQEHHLRQKSGGAGMTDEQVIDFVDRYMPAYELFDRECSVKTGLTIQLGRQRQVLRTQRF